MEKNEPPHLFTLQDWVRSLMGLPPESLSQRFANWESADSEIQSLPFFSHCRWQFRQVPLPLLESLAAKIRGLECEKNLWWGLLHVLDHALPESVAHDLIDREIHVTLLGHTRQTDEVQGRLADLVDEALLTIAKEFYTDNAHSIEEFESILKKHHDHHWMLSSLAHDAVSSPEKSALLEQFLMRHDDATYLMETKRNVGNQRVSPSYDNQEKCPVWMSVPISPAKDQLTELYGTREPEGLKLLASDAQTPVEILEELSNIRDIPMAAEIRRRADYNLRQSGSSAHIGE